MGFLDMGGSLGRRFGSIGVGINEIATQLSLLCSDRLEVTGEDAERAERAAESIARALGRTLPARIHVDRAIPHHAGLGSGTQMALAVGAGLARLHGLQLSTAEIAGIIGRGARSGIGIAVFEQGGLVVDAGRGPETQVPPVISRLQLPSHWRFLIVLDQAESGLHGPSETKAFSALPVFPAEEAARLCHLLLMRGLPAVMEDDIEAFGSVITDLQRSVGDHFAPAQGGRFTSPHVRDAMDILAAGGGVGIGQSSWGPTGFCLVDSPDKAESLRAELTESLGIHSPLQCLIATPRSRGAEIQEITTGFA
jgi:beta-RFAP synthase